MDSKNSEVEQLGVGLAAHSAEFLKLQNFFSSKMPELVLKFAGLNPEKFEQEAKKKKRSEPITKLYQHMNIKQQNLMKSFAGNFTKILTSILESAKNYRAAQGFLSKIQSVMICAIPYPTYCKKLCHQLSRVCVGYSKVTEDVQMLALTGLRQCLILTQDDAKLFDYVVKKMYNEFAKHSKIGGCNFDVWSNLRMAQNCLIEVLRINTVQAY